MAGGKTKPGSRRVDPNRLAELIEAKKLGTRRNLYKQAGLQEERCNPRFTKDALWPPDDLVSIATALDCDIGDFTFDDPDRDQHRDKLPTLDRHDMERLYAGLKRGQFVWIFSADGFLEAHDQGFFEIVARAVDRGVEVTYFFPDLDYALRSQEEFARIVEQFAQQNRRVRLKNLRGHFVSSEGESLYAYSSRFVLFGRFTPKGRHFYHVMLYVGTHGGRWIEMDQLLREDFLARMRKVIDPSPHLPPAALHDRWCLPTLVKGPYQNSFGSDNAIKYAQIRNLIQSEKVATDLGNRLGRILRRSRTPRSKPVLDWLDIGCENGSNTAAIFRSLRACQLHVNLTAIETSLQAAGAVNDILKHSAFLNGANWSLEHFLEHCPRDFKYDVITSVHSWYLIDALYLLTAFRHVRNDGALGIVIAPLANNTLNQITVVVDAIIAKRFGLTDLPHPGKEIGEDPYRNYGEDILKACRDFFGEKALRFEKRAAEVERNLLLLRGGLTDKGKNIVSFFLHGIISPDDEIYSAVAERLSNFPGPLPCEEWSILIEKSVVMSLGQRDLFELDMHVAAEENCE